MSLSPRVLVSLSLLVPLARLLGVSLELPAVLLGLDPAFSCIFLSFLCGGMDLASGLRWLWFASIASMVQYVPLPGSLLPVAPFPLVLATLVRAPPVRQRSPLISFGGSPPVMRPPPGLLASARGELDSLVPTGPARDQARRQLRKRKLLFVWPEINSRPFFQRRHGPILHFTWHQVCAGLLGQGIVSVRCQLFAKQGMDQGPRTQCPAFFRSRTPS